MSMLAEHKLLSMLVRDGAVSVSLADSLNEREPRRIVAALRAHEGVDGEKLTAALARWLHMPYLPGQGIDVSPDVRSLLSRYQPDVLRIVPLRREAGILRVAVEDPFDVDLRERAEGLFGEPAPPTPTASATCWSSATTRRSTPTRSASRRRRTGAPSTTPRPTTTTSSVFPRKTVDLNGNPLTRAYDAFGRLEEVRGPYEQAAGQPGHAHPAL